MSAHDIGWKAHLDELLACMDGLSATDRRGEPLDAQAAFARWRDMTVTVRASRRAVFLIGNGASASMASHFAADLCKNAHIRTEVFTDLAQVTAMANDLGFDQVFAVPLRFRMSRGDMLVAISSSGGSANILEAVQAARECGGTVVTLSAMHKDNPLRGLGDLNFWIPAPTYGLAETGHAAVLHYWMDRMAETRGRDSGPQGK